MRCKAGQGGQRIRTRVSLETIRHSATVMWTPETPERTLRWWRVSDILYALERGGEWGRRQNEREENTDMLHVCVCVCVCGLCACVPVRPYARQACKAGRSLPPSSPPPTPPPSPPLPPSHSRNTAKRSRDATRSTGRGNRQQDYSTLHLQQCLLRPNPTQHITITAHLRAPACDISRRTLWQSAL
jgi:hypothetical protein